MSPGNERAAGGKDIYYLFIYFSIGALAQGLHLEPLHQSFFVLGIFKIGSHKLFPWDGFEPQSS
jgi:hypothetical protein